MGEDHGRGVKKGRVAEKDLDPGRDMSQHCQALGVSEKTAQGQRHQWNSWPGKGKEEREAELLGGAVRLALS